MSELRPGDTLDQYQLLDVIARSGMATIFRARDLDSGRTVALKVPHMQYESDIVFHERFLREEQIGQRLNHPSIVKVLSPKHKSRMYLAMEYVEGERLSDRLRGARPLPIDTAVQLAIQIADAISYLHDHGVVHRDLKPENVMLTPDGKVKLMDFGIALDTTSRKVTWSGLSQTVGTPDYMSPEQVQGKRGDARSDIYSLGIILYEMLTGRVPFAGDNVYAAMRAKVYSTPQPPRQLRPEIPASIEEIVLCAIEQEPHKRFESALEMREALTHPSSVMLTDRTARQQRRPESPRWQRTSITLVVAVLGFAILFWTLAHAVLLLEHAGWVPVR